MYITSSNGPFSFFVKTICIYLQSTKHQAPSSMLHVKCIYIHDNIKVKENIFCFHLLQTWHHFRVENYIFKYRSQFWMHAFAKFSLFRINKSKSLKYLCFFLFFCSVDNNVKSRNILFKFCISWVFSINLYALNVSSHHSFIKNVKYITLWHPFSHILVHDSNITHGVIACRCIKNHFSQSKDVWKWFAKNSHAISQSNGWRHVLTVWRFTNFIRSMNPWIIFMSRMCGSSSKV